MTEERMRSFLLGTMPEVERLAVEEEFFESDEAYDELQDSLNDVLDQYARGELSREDKQRVEEKLLDSPRNRIKLQLAEALAQREISKKRPSASRWLWASAIAASIVAIAWLGFDDLHVRSQFRAQPAIIPSPKTTAVRLEPQVLRGANKAPEIVVPAGNDFVRVELSTSEVYSRYSIEVETPGRGRIWTQDSLLRNSAGAVVLWLPASLLTKGSYEFLLYGTSGGQNELLGSYPCRIESPINTKPAQ